MKSKWYIKVCADEAQMMMLLLSRRRRIRGRGGKEGGINIKKKTQCIHGAVHMYKIYK